MRRVLPFLIFLVFLSNASPALASPWTLPRGRLALVVGYDYQFASEEFLEAGEQQVFPLRGLYTSSSVTFDARLGVSDRFELQLRLPVRAVSFTSDPVVLIPGPEGAGIDYYQENVIDLSQTRIGLGDIWITGRYNLLRWPVAIAIEGALKTPTGYEGPAGTFGNQPESEQDFVDNIGTLVTPENVTDDVSLGDGQVDLSLNLLLGMSFPTHTFARLDIGYTLRFDAGDQIRASLKAGQALGSRVLAYVDGTFYYTVTEGRPIGISVAAQDATLPAADYGGTTNLRLRELRLERDAFDFTFGAIVRVTEATEINIGYSRTLWGRNTAATNRFYVSIGVQADVLTDAGAPPEE